MGRRYDTISFLTDFGTTDEFVGVVKSVIRDIASHAVVIDLTHGIAPFDIRAGSLALARSRDVVLWRRSRSSARRARFAEATSS